MENLILNLSYTILLIISVLIYIISNTEVFRLKFTISLFFYHLLFFIFTYYYSQTTSSDAYGYYFHLNESHYFDENNIAGLLKPGTSFIYLVVYCMKKLLNFSYFNTCFVFAQIGFLGLLFFSKTIESISPKKDFSKYSLFLFLPNLNFWTSQLGKDSLIFMCVCGIIYILKSKNKVTTQLLLFLILLSFIRIHIGILMSISIFVPFFIVQNKYSISNKLFLITISIIGLIISYNYLIEIVDIENYKEISSLIDQRSMYNQEGGSSIPLNEYSFLEKIFAYLFRPLFYDSPNILGFIVSLENLLYLLCFFKIILTLLKGQNKYRFNKFSFSITTYFVLTTVLLSLTTANLGIAIRQKNMVIMCFIILYIQLNAKVEKYG